MGLLVLLAVSYFYFDETIREQGNFIIGALVASEYDLSPIVTEQWRKLGLNPESTEYKSSDPKENSNLGAKQRQIMADLLQRSQLGLTVVPSSGRQRLGEFCTDLMFQLSNTGFLQDGKHFLYHDQNIKLSLSDIERLKGMNISPFPGSDSKKVGGIQVADHTAHALGGMLLEEMGLITKQVRAGEDSGYPPDDLLELGFELWASLRYALIGRSEYIEGLSPHPDGLANPYFRVDGIGLHVASTCPEALIERAKSRFGINHLGCIH